MKKLFLIFKKIGEITIKVILFIVFTFFTGLLFWKGIDPFITGMDLGIPLKVLFVLNFLPSLISIAGALLCICYMIMAVFPFNFLERNLKKETRAQEPVIETPSVQDATQSEIS